jgi:hypothetical protein
MKRLLCQCFVLLCMCLSPLLAMTVRPASLDELVSGSDAALRTRVLAHRCEYKGTGEQRHIVTIVRLEVERVLFGEPNQTIELEFLGGEIDGKGMLVGGQLRFAPGERDILFVKDNRRSLCPVYAVQYGRFLVIEDKTSARTRVFRSDGTAIGANTASPQIEGALTPEQRQKATFAEQGSALEDFENTIIARRAQGKGNKQQ